MDHIPAGFRPNDWDQTLGAFHRLIQQLADMHTMLNECAECSPEDSDFDYIREQVRAELDTLQFMASDAETRWKAISVGVASAAGQFNMDRPADDVAWCSAVLNAAWHFHNGLHRELAGENAELCVQRLPLHISRIPDDIHQWLNRITAEIRAAKLCNDTTKPNPLPDDSLQTMAGDIVQRNELLPSDKPNSSLLSPIEQTNRGTTEGTKNSESGDNADNSKRKVKRTFCDRCQQVKGNWLRKIKREKCDIPLQTFLKEFFANPRKEGIWNPIVKGIPTATTWEAMSKKFRANEDQWEEEYQELVKEMQGAIGGH